jgi:hypothetical protein
VALAASTGLKRAQVVVEAREVRRWLIKLLDAVDAHSEYVRSKTAADPTTDSAFVTVDGVAYKLVIETQLSRIALEVSESGTLDDTLEKLPVVKEMKLIRRRVAARRGQ